MPEPIRPGRVIPFLVGSLLLLISSASAQEPSPIKSTAAHSAEFYRPNEVQSVHLKIAKEDWQRMLAALPERISVKASFRWRDISLDNVGVRFKGNSSSAPRQQHKR